MNQVVMKKLERVIEKAVNHTKKSYSIQSEAN